MTQMSPKDWKSDGAAVTQNRDCRATMRGKPSGQRSALGNHSDSPESIFDDILTSVVDATKDPLAGTTLAFAPPLSLITPKRQV